MRKFEFSKENNNIEILSLDELRSSYSELNLDNLPQLNGIFHHDLINRVGELCKTHNLEYSIKEIFAHKNNSKKSESVSVSKSLQDRHGEGSIESLVLRRVFTTIEIESFSNEEMNTGLVISYHQDGIQVAIGPNVRMCHNQCILGASRMIQTYGGNDRIKSIDKMMDIIDDWFHNMEANRIDDIAVVEKMKSITCTYDNVMQMIGRLNALRVCRDSKHAALKKNDMAKMYPLNQAQISQFTENYLLKVVETEKLDMSLWDIYNVATEMYKPGDTDIPNIITQNVAWTDFLVKSFDLLNN